MKFNISTITCFISYPAVALFSLALLCDTKHTFILCMISSVLHESGHIFTMKRFKAKVSSVCINVGDIRIVADCSKLGLYEDIAVSLSGVAVNFLLSALSLIFYQVFKSDIFMNILGVNLCIGLFNLLPIRYLDGGQVFENLLSVFLTQKNTDRILNIVSVIFLIPILVVGFIFVLRAEYNFSLLLAVCYLICTIVSKELL